MTSRALLVVGGGSNQCGLIRAGKKFATTVIVSDINVNPPGRQFADIFASIDTRDKEANLALARRHDVSAVVTDQTDAAVPTCAYVAESLGLPGIGYELALRFTNKFVMRRILEDKLGDCIPEFSYFDHPSEADEWLTQLDSVSDWIVKPHTSQGSKGVARLSVEKHKTQLWDAFRASNFVGILLERYIVGEEYSVEAFVEQGDVHNLAVTVKEHYPENPCIDVRNLYLGGVSPSLEEDMFALNTRVIKSLGLTQGPTHAEYMATPDGKIFLIEIAARGGGGNISEKLVPYLTGFSPTQGILNTATGVSNDMTYQNYKDRCAIMRFVDLPHGQYGPVHLSDLSEEYLLHLDLDLDREFESRPVRDSTDRLGYFVVKGDAPEQALERESRIMRQIIDAAARARK